MAEFRRIKHLNDVFLPPQLEEKMCGVIGKQALSGRLEGDAWALVENGLAFGVGGIEPIWSGRHVLWSYHHALKLSHWGKVLRFTRLRLQRSLELPGVRRIEATVLVDHPAYSRFIERLGFTHEGVMRAYSPNGETMAMYSMVQA